MFNLSIDLYIQYLLKKLFSIYCKKLNYKKRNIFGIEIFFYFVGEVENVEIIIIKSIHFITFFYTLNSIIYYCVLFIKRQIITKAISLTKKYSFRKTDIYFIFKGSNSKKAQNDDHMNMEVF